MHHLRVALLTLAAGLMLLHCLRFRDFTVDDAGISFAYSQNLAHGDGLVGTTGGERVEGYSNFLWVVLIGAFVALFGHVMIVAKILGLLLALAISIGTAELLAALRRRRSALDALPAALCGALMPVPYWCMSGLENPLYLALVVWGCVCLLREADDPRRRPWSAPLFAALALTRPDGLVVALAAGCAQLLTAHQRRRIGQWLALAAAPVGIHFIWRYRYYGYPWPNTYYVKKSFPFQIRELFDFSSDGWRYLLSLHSRYHLTFLLVLLPFACIKRELRGRVTLFGVLASILFFPLYSRGDWMSEGRYAVAAVPFLFVLAIDGLENITTWAKRLPGGALTGLAVGGVLALLLLGSLLPSSIKISNQRVHHYPVPVEFVAQRARRYRDLAKALGAQRPSVADGDAGGNLLYSGMSFVDLGALNDVTMAHWEANPGFIREYIFGERRPTFIRLLGFWLREHLQDYPEFQEYVGAADGSGLYVARSAFLSEGIDTRMSVGKLTDAVDVLGLQVTPSQIRGWLLVRRDHPAVRLTLRNPRSEQPLVPGEGLYRPALWRAGEVVQLRVDRPVGLDWALCAEQSCVPLPRDRLGAAPIQLPTATATDLERLVSRGEYRGALAALQRSGGATSALAARLYRRAEAERRAGDTMSAFADFRLALQADPSLSSARRAIEELRPAPRRSYHPWLSLRLGAAVRRFYLEPNAGHLDTLVQLAQAAHEPLRAVRAHLATGIVPGDPLALAECYLDSGLPERAAQLLVLRDSATEEEKARTARIALAAGRGDLFARLSAIVPAKPIRVAPGLALTAAAGRLTGSGQVALDLVLQRLSGPVPEAIRIDGREHRLRHPASRWEPAERAVETIYLQPTAHPSMVAVGSARLEVRVAPFAADFEAGRRDGWTITGSGFDDQPHSQAPRPRFGVQGDRFVVSRASPRGHLVSPELSGSVAEVCFFVEGENDAGVRLQTDREATPLVHGGHGVAVPGCIQKPASPVGGWRIAVVDDSTSDYVLADDFICFAADGRSLPCAGGVRVALSPAAPN